jgi:hypothetical protein
MTLFDKMVADRGYHCRIVGTKNRRGNEEMDARPSGFLTKAFAQTAVCGNPPANDDTGH